MTKWKTIRCEDLLHGVCAQGQVDFVDHFGVEAEVSPGNCAKVAHVLRYDYGASAGAGLLTPKQQAEYLRVSDTPERRAEEAQAQEIEAAYEAAVALAGTDEEIAAAVASRERQLAPLRHKRREDCAFWFCMAYNSPEE